MSGELPSKQKGTMLEDMVGDLFKNWGFDVEKRVKLRDKYNVEHEIDVLCSKKEVFGTVKIAIECKYVSSHIEIKEIRNFNEKLNALTIGKGIFVSTGGFTNDAHSYAKEVGLELWDLATLQKKMEKVASGQNVIDDAIAISPEIKVYLLPDYISANEKIKIENISLNFHPYYFVEYSCFSQHTIGGNDVYLESKGIVILSAIDGEIYDSFVHSGNRPTITCSMLLYECSKLSPKSARFEELIPASIANMIESAPIHASPKITETEAKKIVQTEIVKNLSVSYPYTVGRRRREKTIMPKKNDVEIGTATLYNIPILTVHLSYRDKKYEREIQGATLRISKDEMITCQLCYKNQATSLCDECGTVICDNHVKKCEVCPKSLCDNCKVSKGLMFKKHYCKEHSP